MQLTEKDVSRFWSKVHKTNDCWIWTGAIMIAGYGAVTIQRKRLTTHRVSYLIENGDISADAIIMHTCDNRACVNPSHLKAGTQSDNVLDMHCKGRWNNTPARGSQIGTAKLTEQDVIEIRQLYQEHTASQYELARRYHVSQHTICQIVNWQRWKDTSQPVTPQHKADTIQKVERTCLYCKSTFQRTISAHCPESEPFCKYKCRAAWRRQGEAAQFWKNAPHVNTSDCWEWCGSRFKNGYGQSNLSIGRIRLAHRVAWILTYGNIPKGMFVLHACDNRACINPSHLSLGTHEDNMNDMISKSRHGRRVHPETYTHGAGHPLAKFSAEEVREIRKRRKEGATYSQLARDFPSGKSTIARIIKGQKYTDIT